MGRSKEDEGEWEFVALKKKKYIYPERERKPGRKSLALAKPTR